MHASTNPYIHAHIDTYIHTYTYNSSPKQKHITLKRFSAVNIRLNININTYTNYCGMNEAANDNLGNVNLMN